MRFDPFRELDRFADQVLTASRFTPRAMPMDAYRRGDHFVVHLDLPGVDPEHVELTVEQNVLTVRAERTWQPTEGDEVVVAERPQGAFTRQLFLGESLDPDRIEARYDSGVLTLEIPVAERAKPRRVSITKADTGSAAIEAEALAGASA